MTRARVWLRWLGVGAGLALVAFAAAEALVRAFPHLLPAVTRHGLHQDGITAGDFLQPRPDREFGYLWQANTHGRFEAGPFGFSYTTDAHGFRNPGPWPDQAEVVVLGDSQAFGFGVEDDQGWVRRLAELLSPAEVVNLGLIGAATQQFRLAYATFGAPLRPRIVLLALFPPNAVYATRLFDDWVGEGRPDRFDQRRSGRVPETEAAGIPAAFKALLRHSHVMRGLKNALEGTLAEEGEATMTFGSGGRVRLAPSLYEGDAASARPGHPDFERVLEIMLELRADVRAGGGEMIVVLFPTKEEVHLPLLDRPAPRLVAPFADALEHLDLPYLDLTPALRERAARGEHLFFEIDLHPNVAGSRAIAEIIADDLRQRLTAGGDPVR